MPASIDDIRKILRQYGLVKGNDSVNNAVIDRAAQIIFREFQLTPKSEALLEQDLVDLSGATPQSSGSSTPAPVGAASSASTRPPKSLQEQIDEVEKAKALPPPPIPTDRTKPQEGQRAQTTAQQSHFRTVIDKAAAAREKTQAEQRSAARSLSAAAEESETVVEEGDDSEGEPGEEAVIDPEHLSGMFTEETAPVANPKDAMSLQNSLPRKMGEGTPKGSGRSITRLT